MTTAVLVPASPSQSPSPSARDAVVVAATSKATATCAASAAEKMEDRSPQDIAGSAPRDAARSMDADAVEAPAASEDSENLERRGNGGDTTAAASPPAPASIRLKRSHSTPVVKKKEAVNKKKRRRVSFESADIVEFEPTVFTTSVTSGGIPVGMSLQERSRSRRRLDSWEMERTGMRVGRQNYMEEGYLDPNERETILNNAGCAEHSMVTVEAEVNQIIAHRRESNELDFEFLYGLVSIGEEGEDDEEEEEEIEEVQLLSHRLLDDEEGEDDDDDDEEDGCEDER